MKKWDGLVGTMLSGLFVTALLLSLFVVQEASASTDVYLVQPQANTHNNGYNYVTQTFVATCDSVTMISFFLGGKSGSSSYQMEIDSAGSAKGGVMTVSYQGAYQYTDNQGTYGTPVGVKRGYTYTLKISRAGSGDKVDFYYYAPDSTYPWGTITYPSGINGDLCARVVGVNAPPDSTYWGVNGWLAGCSGPGLDSGVTKTKAMGINLSREQVQWRFFRHWAGHDSTQYWAQVDTAIKQAHQQGLRVMLDVYGAPAWAVNRPDSTMDSLGWDSLAWHYAPKNLDKAFADTANYLWQFLDSLATHYSKSPFGVHDYEIWNEVNYYDWFRYGLGRDTLGYPAVYSHDQSGRAKLYALACQVARNAIQTADPNAKIYTNAVLHMNITTNDTLKDRNINGKYWMHYYYQNNGKNYSDVITWHFYQASQWGSTEEFLPGRFIADYDTLRRIMTTYGDTAKPVWADEGGWGTPNSIGDPSTPCYIWAVPIDKQADIAVQATVTGLGQRVNGIGPALGQVNWYNLYDFGSTDSTDCWYQEAGLLNRWNGAFSLKPSGWAYKQMTGKLKGLYFNRRVTFPDTNVYCYEFQSTDTGMASRKTWVVWWNGSPYKNDSLGIRTAQWDSVMIAYSNSVDSGSRFANSAGRIVFKVDTMPRYISEIGTSSRPDVVIDDLYIYPSNPKAGDGVNFFARLKNIGNAVLDSTLADTVTFQVDGVTQVKFRARRGLKPLGDSLDTLTVRNPNPYYDWTANYGDHLIRAWVDSSACFVELRTDNNTGYIFKHAPPSGTINIPGTSYPNGRKFSNTRFKTLTLLGNGGTSPAPSQMKIKNSWGSWTSWQTYSQSLADTLPTTDGLYKVQAEFKMATGETSAIAIDSIILDMTYPVALISSPANKATVSGTVPFYGIANDSGYPPRYFRIDTLRYYLNSSTHDTIHVSGAPVGSKDKQVVTGLLGNWNTTLILNGWTAETLAVWDSAGNRSVAWESLYVFNKYQGGAGFASGFGSTPSLLMNVATDPTGNVYFAETQNSKIRKYSPRKDSMFAFSAKRGSDSTGTSWATAMITKDITTLWIADGYAHAIKRFDLQGNLLLRFGSFGTGQGQFRQPCGIALDGKGRIWVSDRLNNRIQVFDTTGQFLFKFGSLGQDSGRFNSPTGIAYVPKDTALGLTQDLVYISDTRNNQVQVFDSLGNYLQTIKQVDSLGLDTPLGICSDRYGDIFIADARHNRIVELSLYGQRILDFGGQGDSLFQFQTPVGVASSPGAHFLYVADMGNKRVQRFWVIQGDSTGGGGPQTQGPPVQMPPKVNFLNQSHPNPVTGEAVIGYGLAKESPVSLTIYNVAGQVVREYNQGKQKAWYYSINWDGKCNDGHKVGCGVYFYRLKAGDWVKTRKMVVVK